MSISTTGFKRLSHSELTSKLIMRLPSGFMVDCYKSIEKDQTVVPIVDRTTGAKYWLTVKERE